MDIVRIDIDDPKEGRRFVGTVGGEGENRIFYVPRLESQDPWMRKWSGYGIQDEALDKAEAAKAVLVFVEVRNDDTGVVTATFSATLALWQSSVSRHKDEGHGWQHFLGPQDVGRGEAKL